MMDNDYDYDPPTKKLLEILDKKIAAKNKTIEEQREKIKQLEKEIERLMNISIGPDQF